MIVVGIDPDAERHGVAIYEGGRLTELDTMYLVDIFERFIDATGVLFSVENVTANKFLYRRNRNSSRAVEHKVAMSVGRNQQAQVELLRVIEYMQHPHVLYRPTGRNWAENKALFEQRTGWAGRSNKDTRSAAYFGYCALQDMGGKIIEF